MPTSRSSLIAPSLTFIACLISITWILTNLSDMHKTSKGFCSKESMHGLELANTFISLLPGEIPVYPRGVLPADSPAAKLAEKLVDQGEIQRLTLLDRNERSILTAGRNAFGVYAPFPKNQMALNEGVLSEDMRGVALSVPVERKGATQATVGILLPVSAKMSGYYFFHRYYPHLLASVVIMFFVSGSMLVTAALNKPVNPLFTFFQSVKKRLLDLFRQPANTPDMPVEITVNSLLTTRFPSPSRAEEPKEEPDSQGADITTTAQTASTVIKESTHTELPTPEDYTPNTIPQLPALLDDTFAELVKLRNPVNIEFLSSCRETITSIGIDMEDLKQVLLSLMLNACDTMPDGGKLVVRAKLESDDEAAAGQMIRIDVLDGGTGLSAKQQNKIFDPAYNPRSLPPEMVPRLADARNVLERSNGRINVKSQPGKGSCFTIWLPL